MDTLLKAKKVLAQCIVLETITSAAIESGELGIPNGYVYAACSQLVCLDVYQDCINFLKNNNIIAEKSHLLTASPKARAFVNTLTPKIEKLKSVIMSKS